MALRIRLVSNNARMGMPSFPIEKLARGRSFWNSPMLNMSSVTIDSSTEFAPVESDKKGNTVRLDHFEAGVCLDNIQVDRLFAENGFSRFG